MTNFADRTIWTGDNLDILRGLNSASVDLIYLDPPFNSNQNYAAPVGSAAAGAAFKDTWTLSDLDVAWMGLIADEQPAMYQVLQAAGLTHGKGMQSYLCMMAVRLLEMRRVMKGTASIYLHCDPTAGDYETGRPMEAYGIYAERYDAKSAARHRLRVPSPLCGVWLQGAVGSRRSSRWIREWTSKRRAFYAKTPRAAVTVQMNT